MNTQVRCYVQFYTKEVLGGEKAVRTLKYVGNNSESLKLVNDTRRGHLRLDNKEYYPKVGGSYDCDMITSLAERLTQLYPDTEYTVSLFSDDGRSYEFSNGLEKSEFSNAYLDLVSGEEQ